MLFKNIPKILRMTWHKKWDIKKYDTIHEVTYADMSYSELKRDLWKTLLGVLSYRDLYYRVMDIDVAMFLPSSPLHTAVDALAGNLVHFFYLLGDSIYTKNEAAVLFLACYDTSESEWEQIAKNDFPHYWPKRVTEVYDNLGTLDKRIAHLIEKKIPPWDRNVEKS